MTQVLIRGIIFAAGLATIQPATAQELPSPQAAMAEAQAADADMVLSEEDLEALAGGDGVNVDLLTAQTLTAINTGNTVVGQTIGSGQINIANGGLAGFDGVGNFVMNTGHNNNLQSSLNVSIVLAP